MKEFPAYIDVQPPRAFVDELKKPLHSEKPSHFCAECQPREGEVRAFGLFLDKKFPDPEGLLDTVYEDFEAFAKVCGVWGDRYPIGLLFAANYEGEAHRIEVDEGGVRVTAGNAEGIRRALYFLEDSMIKRGGPVLARGSAERNAWVKTRISRCFFSPRNRSGNEEDDELVNGGDYYPDNYLSRLAHDGVNGIWIYTHIETLVRTTLQPQFAEKSELRQKTLNRIIEKCRRYGIRVFVFFSEPHFKHTNGHPEVQGNRLWNGKRTFCTSTPEGREFCADAMYKLFTACPRLGGIINLCQGEYTTSCASALPIIDCPHCGSKSAGEVLADTMDCFAEGMRRAGATGAECIAWSYGMRTWDIPNVRDYVRHLPMDVIELQNFEEGGWNEQLGKKRLATDYWLSYTGPSEMFEATADEARVSGVKMYAKLQVCNSHELATVPYIPAPGLLFDRYKYMHKAGVSGVMQCWFFGNYPSVMSRAAGELSFARDFSDKHAYLRSLASLTFGEKHAEEMACVWETFEEAYKNYPTSINFSYLGPMHAGPTWILQLIPKNTETSHTWVGDLPTTGDRLPNVLRGTHTMEECLTLCERMRSGWREGLSLMERIEGCGEDGESREQLSVARALSVLFDSGTNIVEFYLLREKLGRGKGEARELLARMREIFDAEKENARRLCTLCEEDSRLGFHGEAERYQFHRARLEHRIKALDFVLETEFPEVEARIGKGMPPFDYYTADYKGSPSYLVGSRAEAEWIDFRPSGETPSARMRVWREDHRVYMELCDTRGGYFVLYPERHLQYSNPAVGIYPDGEIRPRLSYTGGSSFLHYGMDEERIAAEYACYRVEVLHKQEGTDLLVSMDESELDELGMFDLGVVCSSGDTLCGGQLWDLEPNPSVYARFVLKK
ncbi:MAG: hypothetical protein J6D16_07225 [Clostridia bacterium]|nr:hypothetical protein [Clostridia bacterium]